MIIRTATLAAVFVCALTSAAEARRARTSTAHPDCNITMPCEGVQASTRGEQLREKLPIGEPQKVYRRKKAARRVPVRTVTVRPAPRAAVPLPRPRPAVPAPTVTEFVAAVMAIVNRPFDSLALEQAERSEAEANSADKTAPAKPPPTIAGFIQHTLVEPLRRALSRSVSLAGVVPPLADKARELERECGSSVISAVRKTYIRGTRRISLHASGQAIDMAGNPACMYERLKGWPGGVTTDYARIKPNHIHISWTGGGREWGARFAHGQRKKARRVQYASAR